MGEDTSYEIFSSNFKNIFNFIISESIPLPPNSDELIITHAAREKYKDLNSLVILNCDFNDAYKIFQENFYLYRATLHPILLKKYHELCLYEPEIQAFSIGELGGVVRTVLYKMNIPFIEIPPTCRAKFATGRGNASKNEVVSSISAKTGITFRNPGADDQCDAWILLEMAKTYLGTSLIDWPKVNLSALEKVDWTILDSLRKDN
jgi:hypothetical protein